MLYANVLMLLWRLPVCLLHHLGTASPGDMWFLLLPTVSQGCLLVVGVEILLAWLLQPLPLIPTNGEQAFDGLTYTELYSEHPLYTIPLKPYMNPGRQVP